MPKLMQRITHTVLSNPHKALCMSHTADPAHETTDWVRVSIGVQN